MVKLSNIATDSAKQQNGVWFPFVADMELLIAAAVSPEWRKYVRETLRPRRKEYRAGRIKEAEMRRLMAPGVAKHLLKGWRGYEDDSGSAVPYSAEHAEQLLLREDLSHLYDFVVQKSRDYGNFVQLELEEDLGN